MYCGAQCWCWVSSLLTAHIGQRSVITYVWLERFFKTSWQIKLLQSYAFQKAIIQALSLFCTNISLYRIQIWISRWERDAMGELRNLAWCNKVLKQRMLHYGNKPLRPQQHQGLQYPGHEMCKYVISAQRYFPSKYLLTLTP